MKVIQVDKYYSFDEFFYWMLPMGGFWQYSMGFDTMLYRGEPSAKHELIPSALRDGARSSFTLKHGNSEPQSEPEQVRMEYYALWDFYKLANENGLKVKASAEMQNSYLTTMSPLGSKNEPYKWLSPEYEELAALAQHYGVKTRMLDWSSDFYTALYFASTGALRNWKKSSSSKWEDKCYDTKDSIVLYILNGGIVHNMSNEMPLKLVVPSYYDNPNLKAQKGVLSYWQIDMPARNEEGHDFSKYPIDKRPLTQQLEEHDLGYDSDHINVLFRVEIDINECGYIYSTVNKLGYNAAKLFPGYDGVAQKLEEDNIYLEFCKWLDGKRAVEYKYCLSMYNSAVADSENQDGISIEDFAEKYNISKIAITLRKRAESFLETLPAKRQEIILATISHLPNGYITALEEENSYCLRVLDYHVVYDITDDGIIVYDIEQDEDTP